MTTSGDEPQVPLAPPSPYVPPTQPLPAPSAPPPPPPPYGHPAYPPQAYAQNPYAQPFGYGMVAPAEPVSSAARMLGWAILAFGVLTAIGAFLPWLSLGPVNVSGLGGNGAGTKDGVLTLPLGLIAGALGLARAVTSRRSALQLVAAIIGLITGTLIALIALVDMNDVTGYGISVGSGLVLTLVAGMCLIGVSIAGIVRRT